MLLFPLYRWETKAQEARVKIRKDYVVLGLQHLNVFENLAAYTLSTVTEGACGLAWIRTFPILSIHSTLNML